MVNKFVIAVGVAAAAMALLVAVPRLIGTGSQSAPSPDQFRLEYDRASDSRTNQTLIVNGDGQSTFSSGLSYQSFQLTPEKLADLKSLVLDTGFMTIPSPSLQSVNSSGTVHGLRVETGSMTQIVSWRSLDSSQGGNAPPIVLQLQQLLDATIAEQILNKTSASG